MAGDEYDIKSDYIGTRRTEKKILLRNILTDTDRMHNSGLWLQLHRSIGEKSMNNARYLIISGRAAIQVFVQASYSLTCDNYSFRHRYFALNRKSKIISSVPIVRAGICMFGMLSGSGAMVLNYLRACSVR